jgi:preprotein translocase subunit SecE
MGFLSDFNAVVGFCIFFVVFFYGASKEEAF